MKGFCSALAPALLGLALASPVPAQDQDPPPIATGPEVGAVIPAFRAQDQTGEEHSFADLTGPKGLLLLFHRTADW